MFGVELSVRGMRGVWDIGGAKLLFYRTSSVYVTCTSMLQYYCNSLITIRGDNLSQIGCVAGERGLGGRQGCKFSRSFLISGNFEHEFLDFKKLALYKRTGKYIFSVKFLSISGNFDLCDLHPCLGGTKLSL